MKRNNNKYNLYAVITIVTYVVTSLIITFAIVMIMYHEHTGTLSSFSIDITKDLSSGLSYEETDLHSFGILVFDSDSNCEYEALPLNPMLEGSAYDYYYSSVRPYITSVLNGATRNRLFFAPKIKMAAMFSAVPFTVNGEKKALFLIRNIQAMFPSVALLFLGYTVLFIPVAIIVNSFLRRREKYNQLQATYVANISHDLKSPITSIRALAETMHVQMPESIDDQKRYCDFIISESIKLEHTVKEILELSSLQTTSAQFEKKIISLNTAFYSTFEKYKMLCYDIMIDFSISDNFKELPLVKTNPDSIARVLDILLDNAVKFVDEENGQIEVTASLEPSRIVISVSDNGIGIREEIKERIFDRFYMGDQSHNSKGSGLGLAIAREIIDGLNEKIWVESEPDKGTTFYFTIHY